MKLKRLPNMLIGRRSYVTGCNCANTYREDFPNKLLHFNWLFMFRLVIQARKNINKYCANKVKYA